MQYVRISAFWNVAPAISNRQHTMRGLSPQARMPRPCADASGAQHGAFSASPDAAPLCRCLRHTARSLLRTPGCRALVPVPQAHSTEFSLQARMPRPCVDASGTQHEAFSASPDAAHKLRPAAAANARTSSAESSRHAPRASVPSRSGPSAMRFRRVTPRSAASHIRRICRFLPS